MEEFCAFGIWPLAKEWGVEVAAVKSRQPALTVKGREGIAFFVPPLFFFEMLHWSCPVSCAYH